jgi:hypothetical protein
VSDERNLDDFSVRDHLNPTERERETEEALAERRAKEMRRAFLVHAMQHQHGRLWLKEVLDRLHTFDTKFANVTGERTWFFAGEQKAGWDIWADLDEADPVLASALRRGRIGAED